jgi:glyoxylase-like metal-dependent hydrolase (beta-lactamase superfamily II)
MTAPAGVWHAGDPLDVPRTIPVQAWLIESDARTILVDAGLHPRSGRGRYGRALGGIELASRTEAISQIGASRSLDLVIVTHLHFDHVGGLNLIRKDVPVLAQSREWAAGHDEREIAANVYMPADYADLRFRTVDGDCDLFGDGRIRLLSTPGHSPGHQSVLVRLDQGMALIVGDAAYFPENLGDRSSPPYGWDKKAEIASQGRVKGLILRGAAPLFSHAAPPRHEHWLGGPL